MRHGETRGDTGTFRGTWGRFACPTGSGTGETSPCPLGETSPCPLLLRHSFLSLYRFKPVYLYPLFNELLFIFRGDIPGIILIVKVVSQIKYFKAGGLEFIYRKIKKLSAVCFEFYSSSIFQKGSVLSQEEPVSQPSLGMPDLRLYLSTEK